MRSLALSLALGLAALAPAAWAEDLPPECPTPVVPTGELAPWSTPSPLNSANYVSQLPDAQLRVGQAAELGLHPTGAVKYPVGPGKPGGNGGLAEFVVTQAGTYRVALSTAAWIDVIQGDKALESISHGHGEQCTGIRKIVDFALTPGRYVVAISANADMRTQVLVARKP